MYYYLVAPTVVVRKGDNAFTYHSDATLRVGDIVRISVGKKDATGIIVGSTAKPAFLTKPIVQTLTSQPLPQQLIKLAYWMSEYYATPLPTVLQTILPAGLHKKRRREPQPLHIASRIRTKIVLNTDQRTVLDQFEKLPTGTTLLHGVTGSGKTQVYIEAAKRAYRLGRSSIILVPEISLTPQLVAQFAQHFDRIILTHSRMTEAERHQAWLAALISDKPAIVIGPRSALFMPIKELGLIVVDECHEPSFKQDQAPRYSALRAASVLARYHTAKALLGSATPTIADYYIAKVTKNPILTLNETAVATIRPTIAVVDLKNRDNFREHRFVSDALLQSIRSAVAEKRQVLIFHNRRGTAPTTLCSHCGWTAVCDNCYVPLVLHADQHTLRCHLCGRSKKLPPSCPVCRQPDITFRGIGTKLIASELQRLFPKARLARFDADNSATETLDSRYQQLYDGALDIIIGTQLLVKGLDLPHLGVVGVLQADSGLQLPDYGAEERIFQLLYQVVGRVGRSEMKSDVVIQSYQPEQPIIRLAVQHDYQGFYQQQLAKRRETLFPPFVYLLKLICVYKTERGAIRAAQQLAQTLRAAWQDIVVLGPTPAFYERVGTTYRWQLLIKSKNAAHWLRLCTSYRQLGRPILIPAASCNTA